MNIFSYSTSKNKVGIISDPQKVFLRKSGSIDMQVHNNNK